MKRSFTRLVPVLILVVLVLAALVLAVPAFAQDLHNAVPAVPPSMAQGGALAVVFGAFVYLLYVELPRQRAEFRASLEKLATTFKEEVREVRQERDRQLMELLSNKPKG